VVGLIVLAVAGFLLYKHFEKKPLPPTMKRSQQTR